MSRPNHMAMVFTVDGEEVKRELTSTSTRISLSAARASGVLSISV